MSRMLAIQGDIPGGQEPEVLYVRENGSWYSPPGGWMAVQSGKWQQISLAGTAMQGIAGTPNVFMAGLLFASAKPGDSGELRDQVSRAVGRWKVTAVTG